MLFSEYELWPQEELDIFSFSEVPEAVFRDALNDGNKYIDNNWEVLTAAMYTDARHEPYCDAYKSRRTVLARLALAEYTERKGRFMQDIINGIWCICDESTWILPDDTGKLRCGDRVKFDINSAKTAALLATVVHIFRKELPPEVKKRVYYKAEKRVFEPFYDACAIGTEAAAHTFIACMFTERNEEKRRRMTDKILELLDVWLDEFAGGKVHEKSEKGLYNRTAYLFDILEMLYNVTDQKFSVFSDEKIKIAAECIYKAHLGSDGFSETETDSDGARIYLFGKRMDYKKLCDFGASEYLKLTDKTLPESTNLFHKLYSVKHASEIIGYGDNFDAQECGYIEGMDLFVKKTKGFSVAVKGGHSSAGNFMAYLENEPYVIDLEKSHNLPVINGFTQFTETRRAVCEKMENGLSIDMSRTYPKEAGVISWMRSIEAEEKYVIITDDYELTKNDDIRLILLMKNKPILSGDRILVGDGSIVWDGNMALRVELVKSRVYDYVYRLIFHVKDNELKGRIRIALKK